MSMKKRTSKELADGVKEWVDKKYHHLAKRNLRNALFQGKWNFDLVIHHVKFPEELKLIEGHGIKIYQLNEMVANLSKKKTLIQSAAGTDLLELVMLGQK